MLQIRASSSFDARRPVSPDTVHGLPPCFGEGLLHRRDRNCLPPSHDSVHCPKFDHSPQLPSTEREKERNDGLCIHVYFIRTPKIQPRLDVLVLKSFFRFSYSNPNSKTLQKTFKIQFRFSRSVIQTPKTLR